VGYLLLHTQFSNSWLVCGCFQRDINAVILFVLQFLKFSFMHLEILVLFSCSCLSLGSHTFLVFGGKKHKEVAKYASFTKYYGILNC
jgi:hypothetical protein